MIADTRQHRPRVPIAAGRYGAMVIPTAAEERLGRRIAIHVAAGRYGVAHEILDRYEQGDQLGEQDDDPRDRPVSDLGLRQETANALFDAGVRTVGDILTCPAWRMLAIPQIGQASAARARRAAERAIRQSGV